MNNFGNRGFGGYPQPQRNFGRRNNRNSRFEQRPNNYNNQANAAPVQRLNEPAKPDKVAEIAPKTVNQVNQTQQSQQVKVNSAPIVQAKPNPPPKVEPTPVAQQNKPPVQQNLNKPPVQQNLNKPPPQQTPNKPPPQQTPNKPLQQQNSTKPLMEQTKPQVNQNHTNDVQNNHQSQQKMYGNNFGGPNRQSGNFGGGNKSAGGAGMRQGSGAPGMKQGGGGPMRGPMRGGRNLADGPPHLREEQMLTNKLKDLVGPLTDLPPLEQSEVKFNGRSRLYIGNLSNDITEQEILDMFRPYGESSEFFHNKEKNFAFIRMDFRSNAEKAKRELDGTQKRGRPLRVRFAPHNSAIRVKNLTPFVTNELLYRAFEIFGKIERAYVKVDDRGKTLGEGVVEFARKPSAMAAIRNCTEKCFFLTSSLRPVIVESFEEPDELDGYQEKNLPKKHIDFIRSREIGPRFSEPNSFQHEFGTRWKQLHELYRQKEEALRAERASEEEKLEAQMEYAKYEHDTEMLRDQLRQREQDRDRQKRSWEMAERAAEERREAERLLLLRQEEELSQRMRLQDDELCRRQQENTLFVQAQHLSSMLDRQEQGVYDSHSQQAPQSLMDGVFMDQYDAGRGYDDVMPNNPRWEGARHPEDYPNKRRRF